MDNRKRCNRLFPLKSRKRKNDGFDVHGAEHYLSQSMAESIAHQSAAQRHRIKGNGQNICENIERERQKKMAKVNAFMAKQQAMQQKCFEVGCDTTAQQFFDYLCIVLNDPDVMGKDVFGANRLNKIHDALKAVDKQFSEAFVNSQESDYYQEKMDAVLKRIFGEIEPFNKRYPFMKEWNYNKRSGK